VMGGTLDLVQRIYLGTEVREDVLFFEPRLRERLDGLALQMLFRGTPIRVRIEGNRLTVEALKEGFSEPVWIGVGDDVRELNAGDRCTFPFGSGAEIEKGQACRALRERSSMWTACWSIRHTRRRGGSLYAN